MSARSATFACPNAGLGAADVAVGQPWLRYATDPSNRGTYEVHEVDGSTIGMALLPGFDYGDDACHYLKIEVGHLLAYWQFLGATA